MSDLRAVLERYRDATAPPPDALERLVALRRRRHLHQRVATATIALFVGIGGLLMVGRAFDISEGQQNAPGVASSPTAVTFIRDGELWTISPDGTGESKIAFGVPGGVNGVEWAPDGSRMAVSVEVNPGTEGGQFRLYLANADGGDVRRLTEGVSDRFPAWSPDGSRIAFTRDLSDGNQELFLINADGTGETQLTDTDGANMQPTWSPDGTRIAFTSTRGGTFEGNSEIYVMNSDGLEQRRITDHPGWDAAPDWSADGRIAYTSEGPEAGIYVVDPDVGDPELLLADSDPFNLFIAWSPDARSLALASRRDADAALFVLDVATGEMSRLSEGDLLWGPAWRRL